jgi:hypothetical protein
MIDPIFVMLAGLCVKHWYIDFAHQTPKEIANKGIYLNWYGITHSIKHAVGTFMIFKMVGLSPLDSVTLAGIDFMLHYHIDWIKMKYGNKDTTQNEFWNELGLDQMAHYFTYLFLVWIAS